MLMIMVIIFQMVNLMANSRPNTHHDVDYHNEHHECDGDDSENSDDIPDCNANNS